jgi:type I restriction enzyme M protein
VFHLAPSGRAGVVLAKGALTSKTSGEGEIRKALIADGNLIDCIVNLPAKLFLNTQIPAGLWFLNRARPKKGNVAGHPRGGEILFIDARNLGHLINRRTRELSQADIELIASTYHAWRTHDPSSPIAPPRGEGPGVRGYEDVKGFCASVPIDRVAELDYVLTPGRYVGLPDEEDDFNFVERFQALKAEFEAQLVEETKLNKAIAENLAKIKV